MEGSKKIMDSKLLRAAICVLLGVIIYVMPPPQAFIDFVSNGRATAEASRAAALAEARMPATAAALNWNAQRAWHVLAITIATIAALILQPLPMGGIAIIAITLPVFTRTLTMAQTLAAFTDATIWLIVCAFFISRGFIKTGLGTRIAFLFMKLLGKNTLGLSYAFVFTDLVMAPAMPSNTARAGGVIMPLIRSLADAFDSKVENGTERRIGSFLTKSVFQGDMVVCAMFMTAMAANPLAVNIAASQGIEITWASWAIAASVPGIICILCIPLIVYKLYPPEIKRSPQAVEIATKRLKELGPVTTKEKLMLFVFALLLVFWIFGPNWHSSITATATAFLGLSIMLIVDILTFDDVKSEKAAWDTLVWFSALVMLAGQLNTTGFIPFFGQTVGASVSGFGWLTGFVIIALAYFYSHYFFASATAHVSAMYGAMLAVAVVIGTPPLLAALILAMFSNVFMGITHYGTGLAPVFFGPGYVPIGKWWGIGFILSVFNIIIFFSIGFLWWKVLGLW